MKLSIYNFRNAHLMALFVIWLIVVVYNERIVPRTASSACQWPQREGGRNFLIVSDPQLIDNHTYPGRPSILLKLSQFITNNYLYKNYRSLLSVLKPSSVIFIGDYLDNGRLDFQDQAKGSTIYNYEKEMARFNFIFNSAETSIVTNVPGNHDVGWENGVTSEALDRFHHNFGKTNVIVATASHDLVLLDSLSLSNTVNESIYGPPRKLLDTLDQSVKERPRILFTHVPLWKDDPSACGPLRESSNFPISKGFQYQTVLTKELSDEILEKIKPDLVLSGDDHDYCAMTHTYGTSTKHETEEITVKSISMAMGINRPAVQLLTLYESPIPHLGKTYITDICYLPKPYNETIIYCCLAFVSLVVISLVVIMRTSSISVVLRKHNLYQHKEEPVSYDRLSSYLQHTQQTEEEVNLNLVGDLRGSYTYHTSNFADNLMRKRTHKRINYLLIVKHELILFIAVFLVYWCFTKEIALA